MPHKRRDASRTAFEGKTGFSRLGRHDDPASPLRFLHCMRNTEVGLTKGVAAGDVAVSIGVHIRHEGRLPTKVLQDLQRGLLLLVRGAIELALRGSWKASVY